MSKEGVSEGYNFAWRLARNYGIGTPHESQVMTRLAFLEEPEHVSHIIDVLKEGFPIVLDGGAMYGIVFLPNVRKELFLARTSEEQRLKAMPVVGVVATYDVAMGWLDKSKVDPKLVDFISGCNLKCLSDIAFLRFPIKDTDDKSLFDYSVSTNTDGINVIQVSILSDEHPLLRVMKNDHGLDYFLVRSANMSKKPECTTPEQAYSYSQLMGCPAVVFSSMDAVIKHNEHHERERFGSIPVIEINPTGSESSVTLRRAGNTHPDTMMRLLRGLLPSDIKISYEEEKSAAYRKQYRVSDNITDPWDIRADLLRSSGL